jgi:hypothetical protein
MRLHVETQRLEADVLASAASTAQSNESNDILSNARLQLQQQIDYSSTILAIGTGNTVANTRISAVSRQRYENR